MFCCDNILKFILRNPRSGQLGQRDLIYSLGLLDYFSLQAAKRIIAALWPSVAPGGRLLVTNAHPMNPTRLWMEWGGGWFLDYKTEDEMRSLATGLEGMAAASYEIDPFGVYQYVSIKKAN